MFIHESIQKIPVSKWRTITTHVDIDTAEEISKRKAEREYWVLKTEKHVETERKLINNTYVKYGYKKFIKICKNRNQLKML